MLFFSLSSLTYLTLASLLAACSNNTNNTSNTTHTPNADVAIDSGFLPNDGYAAIACDAGTEITPSECPNVGTPSLPSGGGCAGRVIVSRIKTANILLVVEKSAEMNLIAEPDAGLTRWDSLKSALNATLTRLVDSSQGTPLHFGLELFPNDPAGVVSNQSTSASYCNVPRGPTAIAVDIDPASDNLKSIFDELNTQVPAGGTPTTQALKQAYYYFTLGPGKCLSGAKWVMLVTQGMADCHSGSVCAATACTVNKKGLCPNDSGNCCDGQGELCQDDVAAFAAIDQLAAAGIKTLVIGIPKTTADITTLNNFAFHGGLPNSGEVRYYAIPDSIAITDLELKWERLVSPLSFCDIPLVGFPTTGRIGQDNGITSPGISFDCVPLATTADAGDIPRFTWDGTNYPAQLHLLGSTCDALKNSGVRELDFFWDFCVGP